MRLYDGYILQAAKDVRRGKDKLIDVFERNKRFFWCLEVYTEVPPTTEMMDTIISSFVFGWGDKEGSRFEERRVESNEKKKVFAW